MKKPIALALMVGLFVLGGLVGAMTTHLTYARRVPPPPEPTLLRPPPFLRHLNEQLDLSPEQREEIRAILEDSHLRMETIRRETAPELRAIYRGAWDGIQDTLTPEQRRTLRRMHRRRHSHWDRFLTGPDRPHRPRFRRGPGRRGGGPGDRAPSELPDPADPTDPVAEPPAD